MRVIRVLFLVIFLMTVSSQGQSVDYTRAPNSYIFDINFAQQNGKGGLMIPVKKAYEVWASNEYLTQDGINIPIPQGQGSASLYWEDVPGLIRSVELVGAGEASKIKVMIDQAKGKGNALVAFKIEGEVYWSWHIWITDDPSDGVVYSQEFETDIDLVRFDPKYMDRNLGALNNQFLGDDWHKSAGLMYQWGRKDPFPTMVYKDFSFYELNGEDIGTMRHKDAIDTPTSTKFKDDFLRPYDEIEKNISFSVRNPLTYISNTDDDPYTEPNGTNGTWFSKQQYRNATTAWDLWGDNYRGDMSNASSSNTTLANDSKSYELKSPYDPCPNGWRIPSFYGRITSNNNHSPWGRKNSGGNDAANPLHSFLYPNTYNPVLNGVKVYIGLGMDFTEVPNRNLGIMPIAGNMEYYPNIVSPTSIPHTEYQDEAADGALWSATYGQGGAKMYKMIADLYKDPFNENSPANAVFATSSTRPKEGNALRCMQDPNMHKIGSFETEYVDGDVVNYTEGIDNPNSYIISLGQLIQTIPVNKAFAVYNQYLTDHEMLSDNDLKANVYWTTNSQLVSKVYLIPDDSDPSDMKKSSIVVELNPEQTGNAVISLHNGDITNPVNWSWHIWVPQSQINKITYTTEEIIPANYNFVNLTNSRNPPLTTTFMDRNLGAIEAFPHSDDPDLESKAERSGGFYYQWGRKDPIPTFTNPGAAVYNIFKGTSVNAQGEVTYDELNLDSYNSEYTSDYTNYSSVAGVSESDRKSIKISKIMKFSSQNPMTYLYQNGEGIKDWLSDELGYGQERWGHGTSKSPFDPCPAGWRVPDMTFVFTEYRGSSPWFNGKKLSSQQANPHFLGSHYGGSPVTNGNITLGWIFNDPLYNVGNYPATGIRSDGNTIQGIGFQTGIWTASVSMRQQSNAFAFRIRRETNGDYRVTSAGSFSPQNGMNVRCSVDEPRYTGEQICPGTTWNGSNWSNGIPDLNKKAIINGTLILSSDLEACELEVMNNGNLLIPSGFTFTVKGIVINNASAESFIVSSGANLIQQENIENIGPITVRRDNQPFKRLDYTMWSSPVSGQQLQAFSPMTLPNRITTYEGILSYVAVPDVTVNFLKGKGYMFRAPNNWSATPEIYSGEFKGVPFNGDIILPTHPENHTSIGNPYPSNISADALMLENPGISTLYFWTNVNPVTGGTYAGNNYATYTFLGGTSSGGNVIAPNGIISVGQGFLVGSYSAEVIFRNPMRVDNQSIFYRNEELEKHRMWLDLKNEEEFYNQIIIGYMDGATNGIDNQIDGKHFGYQGSALYNLIGEEKFTIQGRALPFQISDVVKLGFKAVEAGRFTILLSNFDGLFTEGEFMIYVKDNDLNLIHNLMESSYTFESPSGEFTERFEIVYQEESTMAAEDIMNGYVQIYTNNKDIIVESKNEKIVSVELYDLNGRKINSNQNLNTNFHEIKSNSNGIWVVKVQTQNSEMIVKKIIIK
ncbi:T9SS type A sorting domain-containing protein [Moheibacter sediminis]|uniref:Por secretion system C-terminal sorting domain-containing protein n=1 Tax=Moheibacter sediminis TaxID=1434700 RepID=A0A1W2ALY0_9FLAO|nr:T9SS type A sorting domain-containing protein [Moheibacter sediminis]SMC61522.1 Por secretion system C-terminal sorting domain-containing protein [Moheibacter sediminis]